MADATVVEAYIEGPDPTVEYAELTVSDGETYQSRRFNSIRVAIATAGADDDGEINCVVSAGQVTINFAGATDVKVYLLIYGNP